MGQNLYCGARSPSGWLCVLRPHEQGDHLSIDNRETWKGSIGKPVRWMRQGPQEAAPTMLEKVGREILAETVPTHTELPEARIETQIPASMASTMTQREIAKAGGFTGNQCGHCGNMRMVQNGNCEKCSVCGETSGCS